jgi:ribosome-binding protein aMBF1 (putative translation factor)
VCPHLTNEDAERCKQFADKGEYIKVGKYQEKYSTNSVQKTVGQILWEKRKARGWTQKKLASKIDSCQGTVASWERGDAYPNALFLTSLADVFECTIDELCGREVKINE